MLRCQSHVMHGILAPSARITFIDVVEGVAMQVRGKFIAVLVARVLHYRSGFGYARKLRHVLNITSVIIATGHRILVICQLIWSTLQTTF